MPVTAEEAILRAMLVPSIAAFDDTSICFHCAQPNRVASQWHAVFDGADRRFCCAGCLGITQTIHAAGLDRFYRRRDASSCDRNEAASANESERVADAAEAGGLVVHLDEHSRETSLLLEGMHCGACIWLIESYLSRQPGLFDQGEE